MSDLPATRVYPCETVDDFLKKLRPPTAFFDGGITNTILYRGVGDAEYELRTSSTKCSLAVESSAIRRSTIPLVVPS